MLSGYLQGRAFGERYGTSAPWVLAVHGWGRTHVDFARVLGGTDAEQMVDAIALDLPGFGASPAPDGAWGAKDYAAFLRPLLDEMAGRVVLVGHSFGGRAAVELAALADGQVAALVLTGVPLVRLGRPPRPPARYRVVRSLAGAGIVSQRRLDTARERYGSRDYREARGIMRDVLVRALSEDYRPSLARLRCPVELVWGERDTVVPVAVAEAALKSIAEGRLTVLAGVDHFVPTSAPAALRTAMARHRP
ncbi:MAG: alpha/beta hydrolase [Acidimicrobiales bacterium]|jgi:pimeloyl-ACP methyl ester carboxylesterase